MLRSASALGSAALAVGGGLILPVVVAQIERGTVTSVGQVLIAAGCALAITGSAMVWIGRRSVPLPVGVRIALAANIAVLGFFALELSDRLARHDGRVFYWSTFLSLPAVGLFIGLSAARVWAWRIWRSVTAIAVIWFLVFIAMLPFVHLEADGVPTPWYGRVYMALVSLAFAGVFAAAFHALGKAEVRSYFGIAGPPALAGRPVSSDR